MAGIEFDLAKCDGFEWDEHNALKNWIAHQVSPPECEQIFLNRPLVLAPDVKHSNQEDRYYERRRSLVVRGFQYPGQPDSSYFGPKYEPQGKEGVRCP